MLGDTQDESFSESQRLNLVQVPALQTLVFGQKAFDSARKLNIPTTTLSTLEFGEASWTKMEAMDLEGWCGSRR